MGKRPAPWANTLREDLLGNSGILRGEGGQGYFFLHLTLQEFLAAAALAHQVNVKGWEAKIDFDGQTVTVHDLVDHKAWDPRWQEVLLLFAGQLDDPVPWLALLAAPAPTPSNRLGDDVFRHRLALAALSLAEIPAARLRLCEALVDRITTDAFKLWWQHATNDTAEAVFHLSRAFPALGKTNGRENGQPLLARLVELLADQNIGVQETAAKAVKAIGAAAATPAVLARLADLLVATENYPVLLAAASTVAALGAAAATPAMLALLADVVVDEYASNRYAAAHAAHLGVGWQSIGAELADYLVDMHEHLLVEAAERTASAFEAKPAIPDSLARLAERLADENEHVRWGAALTVGALGVSGGHAPSSWRAWPSAWRARTSRAWWPSSACGRRQRGPWVDSALWPPRRRSWPAWPRCWRTETGTCGGRPEAVKAIGPAAATPEFLARLAELLAHGDAGVWVAAAQAAGAIGAPATPAILARLEALLADGDSGRAGGGSEGRGRTRRFGRHAGDPGPPGRAAGGRGPGRTAGGSGRREGTRLDGGHGGVPGPPGRPAGG